jgi:hypothetical protein
MLAVSIPNIPVCRGEWEWENSYLRLLWSTALRHFKPELAVLFNSVQKRIQQPYMGIDSYIKSHIKKYTWHDPHKHTEPLCEIQQICMENLQ